MMPRWPPLLPPQPAAAIPGTTSTASSAATAQPTTALYSAAGAQQLPQPQPTPRMDIADAACSPRGHTPYAAAYSQGRRSLAAAAATKRLLTQRRRPLSLLRVLLVVVALAAAVGAGAHARRRRAAADAVRCVLVIDSGSSGTRIYAYNLTAAAAAPPGRQHRHRGGGSSSSSAPWPLLQAIPPSAAAHLVPKHAATGMYSRVETRPGLDAFAQPAAALQATAAAAAAADGSAANASLAGALQPLLAWAAAVVPRSHHARTPLFLFGTGGLRRLAPEQREVLLQQIRQLLARSGFRFEPSWARVISGDDEGAFGWLALNYLQGRLRRPPPAPARAPAAKAAKAASSAAQQPHTATITSLGALDLGGSSLQITFEVHPPHMDDSASGLAGQQQQPDHNVTVAGHTFHLHLHSFKSYGLNDAFDRGVTLLLRDQQRRQGGAATAQATDAAVAAGANGTTPAVVEGSSSSSGAITGAHVVEAAVQHDLAVARAAGVIGPGDDAAPAATASAAVDAAASAAAAADGADAGMGHTALAGGDAGSRLADTSLERLAEQQAADLVAAAAAVGEQQPTASSSSVSTSQDHHAASVALNDALQQAAAESSASESAVAAAAAAAAAQPDILDSRGRRQQLLGTGNRLRRRRLQQLQQQLQQLEAQQLEQHSSTSRLRQLLQEGLGVVVHDGASPASSSRALRVGDAGEVPLAVDARRSSVDADGGSVSKQQQPAALAAVTAATAVRVLPVVHHPCLHTGYEAPYARVAHEGVTPQPAQVLLRGAPNWEACLQLVDRVVNKSAPCAVSEHRPACVLGTPQPELHGSFVALTGFYVVSKFLGAAASGGTAAAAAAGAPTTSPGGLEQLLSASQALCARPWSEVQAQLGSHINVERYCTWGLYVVRLLLHGLGLEERQLLFTSDGGLGWPLGAALVEASNLGAFEASGGSSSRAAALQAHASSGAAAGTVHTSAAPAAGSSLAASSSSLQHATTANQQQQQHRTHHRRRRSWVHHQLRLKGTGSRHSASSRAAHLGLWLLALLGVWFAAAAVCNSTSGSKAARSWGLTASTSHGSLLPLHGVGAAAGAGGRGAVISAGGAALAMAGQLFHTQHHRGGSFKK